MIPVIFINCTHEKYIDHIMGGLKLYETRNVNTLQRFVGERVLFAETGHGKPLVKCSAIIDEVIEVRSSDEWEEYLQFTWIPVGSKYDWKPDTKVKYLYHLTDVKPVADPFRLPSSCRRHGRVWAELDDLIDVTYTNTGGMVMCYSARYKGMYWIFGATDQTMSAYTIDPLHTFDEDGYYLNEEAYRLPDITDFPTWAEVIESIYTSGQYEPYGMDFVKEDILYFEEDLNKRVNIE